MMKIYTAGLYTGKYSRCSVIVMNDYIYSADCFVRKATGSVDTTLSIGKIDRQKGVIRENGLFPQELAEFERINGEIRVYKLPRAISDIPVLTVRDNKIYAGFGGQFSQPRGYIEPYSTNTRDAQGQATDFGKLYRAIFGGEEIGCFTGIIRAVGAVALLAALIGLIGAAVFKGTKSLVSGTLFLATHVPIILVSVIMTAVLTVNLKKTFNLIKRSAAVKQQCRRASLPVALKAMIVPVAAALLGMVLSGETAVLMMSVPFLIVLFVYCWVVVCRMMQAGLLNRQGRLYGGNTRKSFAQGRKILSLRSFASAWNKFLQKFKRPPKSSAGSAVVERVLRPCPHCAAKCRVPAGRGRMTITCPLCHTKYQVNT